MAAKNLIISAFTNYSFDHLKPYVYSIRDLKLDADLVMVVGVTDIATKAQLETLNWKIIKLPLLQEVPVHVLRFLSMYDYLYSNKGRYNLVVSTDVKDVIFQSDPFAWLNENLQGKKLVAGSEGLKYCNEPWGDDNLRSCYGDYVYEHFKNKTIYNVGTLGGECEYMQDLFFNLFFNSLSRPISIVDQAVFNVTIHSQPYRDTVLFAEQRAGWACQAGTVVDPSKINYFRPYLLEPEPIWNGEKVLTSQGKEFSIVHQYDRVPEWRKFYMDKYK